jgi:hypothetical protein
MTTAFEMRRSSSGSLMPLEAVRVRLQSILLMKHQPDTSVPPAKKTETLQRTSVGNPAGSFKM